MTQSRLLTVCVWIGLLSRVIVASADEPHFRRWAVLPAPEVAATGLSDLLTAELSQRSFDLVEREQLAAITKEIELSKLLSPEGSSQRLKVGQLAKADALVLLSLVEHDKKQFVKLVISDCRYGSRLRQDHFPFAADRADKLAAEIAQAAIEARTKFARGVERLVAVSPFLSKNLTHEFDHLQFGFAALLGQGLSERPGVAVLEIEEARAIGEELTRSTTELDRRAVPLFVEGEFEVLTPAKVGTDQETVGRPVRIALRVFDGRVERESLTQTAATLAETTTWLSDTLPTRVLKHTASAPATQPLTHRQQSERLIDRAQCFSEVALFSQSTALREAALLLKPDDWKQRLALIGDYHQWQQLRTREMGNPELQRVRDEPTFKQRWTQEFRERIAILSNHTEQLLAQRMLNPGEGWSVLSTVLRDWEPVVNDPCELTEARSDREAFFWNCLRQVARLDPNARQGMIDEAVSQVAGTPRDRSASPVLAIYQFSAWTSDVMNHLLAHFPRHFNRGSPRFDDRDTLQNLERFFLEIYDQQQLSPNLLGFLGTDYQLNLTHIAKAHRIAPQELVAFYTRLRESKRPVLEFYARFGLLGLKVSGISGQSITQADFDEAQWLEQFLKDWASQHADTAEHVLTVSKFYLRELRANLDEARKQGGQRKAHLLTRNFLSGNDPFPRIAFEPLPQLPSPWHGLTKCGDDFDLMWSWNAVYIMTQPGKTTLICQSDPQATAFHKDQICSVVWDGELIWVASLSSGLRVFTREGRLVAQLPPSGEAPRGESNLKISDESASLPPIDQTTYRPRGLSALGMPFAIRLHPLEPGRCFVVGRAGQDGRRWFGCVTRLVSKPSPNSTKSAFQFRQWHQATKQSDPNSLKQSDPNSLGADDDPQVIFNPVYFLDYVSPADPRRWLLVGRPAVGVRTLDNSRRPLAFNVATGAVSIFPHAAVRNPEGDLFRDVASRDRFVVFPSTFEIVRCDLDRLDKDANDKLAFHPLAKGSELTRPGEAELHLRRQLLRDRQWLYNPGLNWRRIDTDTWQTSLLNEQPVSNRFQFECFGVSAHYGLVAWNTGDVLNRVHVDVADEKVRDLSWLYPFVPAARRVRHAQAVQAIRQMGGAVDTRWEPSDSRYDRPVEWRTLVYLSDKWRGGHDGLRHLAELHELRELFLVQVPVTNAGLHHVGQLKTLEVLHLEETKATNEGLRELNAIPNLKVLHLEGTVGGREFTDWGLAPLQEHGTLSSLTLYGSGFTDKALPYLTERRSLRELRFIDTAITTEAIADLKKKHLRKTSLSVLGQ